MTSLRFEQNLLWQKNRQNLMWREQCVAENQTSTKQYLHIFILVLIRLFFICRKRNTMDFMRISLKFDKRKNLAIKISTNAR